MSEKTVIDYWIKSSQEDLITAESLFNDGRFLHCLFFCHLFLEKILKAIYISINHNAPPMTHDLLKLASESDLDIKETMKEDMREISRFNIVARYDDYKFSMHKKADKKFTGIYFQKAKEIYKWLKNLL